jgi:hypothetical protein
MQTIKLSPQSVTVLKHLQKVGSITAVEASAVHRVRSLSRRITEIRDAGFCVQKEFKQDVTGQRYVRYSLDAACLYCKQNLAKVEGI